MLCFDDIVLCFNNTVLCFDNIAMCFDNTVLCFDNSLLCSDNTMLCLEKCLLCFKNCLLCLQIWATVQKSVRLRTGQPDHVKFTFGMHKVVANFICKLLEFQAFNHLKQKIVETEAKQATGKWSFGEQATVKMIHWCQDQWRRKRRCLPDTATPFADNEPMTVAWNTNIPVCFNCGIPCSNCMEELNEDMPMEMSTARALMSYEEIHQPAAGDHPDDGHPSNEEDTSDYEQELRVRETPQLRMRLRSKNKVN